MNTPTLDAFFRQRGFSVRQLLHEGGAPWSLARTALIQLETGRCDPANENLAGFWRAVEASGGDVSFIQDELRQLCVVQGHVDDYD